MGNRRFLTWLAASVLVQSSSVAIAAQVSTLAIAGINVVDVVEGPFVPESTDRGR